LFRHRILLAKIILIIFFCPTTKVVRLLALRSSSIETNNKYRPLSSSHRTHPILDDRKKNRRTDKQAMGRDFSRPCPCALVSHRCSFPSPQPRQGGWIDLVSSISCERGADTPPWCLPHCCLSRTELHLPSMHTHAPPPPFHQHSQHFKHRGPDPLPSSLSKSLISTNSGFVASWSISVPGVCVCLSSYIHVRIGRLVLSSTCDTTTTTVLPIPHPTDASSPHSAKIASS
jgi:hypothetical protein